jgi:hypothetical protein
VGETVEDVMAALKPPEDPGLPVEVVVDADVVTLALPDIETATNNELDVEGLYTGVMDWGMCLWE